MRRGLAILAVPLAALAFAPAASAAPTTFVVNDPGDLGDALPGDDICDTDVTADGTPCTLRAAIEEANADTDRDTVDLTTLNQPILVATTLEAGVGAACTNATPCPVTIRDDLGSPVRWTGAAGPLLRIAPFARGTLLQALQLENAGGMGTLLQIEASNVEVQNTTVTGANGDGARVEAGAQQVLFSSPTLTNNSDDGIEIAGTQVTVFQGQAANNGGRGVHVVSTAQRAVASRVSVFANGLRPILLDPGANGGIQPPQNLRVGPRQADGTLPVTGTVGGPGSSGTVELFTGDPAGPNPIAFFAGIGASGDSFHFVPNPELSPGTVVAATVTGASAGTSEFATTVVPSDVVSPEVTTAVATSLNEVRLNATEPVEPGSLQPEDFVLDMAGQRRAIESVRAEGSAIFLRSSGWTHGEAGFVQLTGAGVLTDVVGNLNVSNPQLRVGAAPGDVVPPVVGGMRINPSTICLTRGRGCRRAGGTVSFFTTEPGRAQLVILRGNRRLGVDIANAEDGRNTVRFTGRLGNRKLRPGSYRMLLYLEDAVGNVTVEPAIQRFTVRRTASSRRARP